MHYHGGLTHSHDFDDPEHEHEMASEFERVHGLRYVDGHEAFELNSVGIDIGSSTSHLMFSRLMLMRVGSGMSGRFEIVEREVTYASPILLTPYLGKATTIDVEALDRFIGDAYRAASIERDGIDAGAVIVTGEAAKKENAEAIAALFAEQAGKFVCATAGPNLEALMAAYGSGAVDLSESRGKTVLNVDVGGGTSKLSVVQAGRVVETFAINVGARLVAMDADGRLTRIEDAARTVAETLGIQLELGEPFATDDQRAIADRLADCLLEAVRRDAFSPLAEDLIITEPIGFTGALDMITCSGGVGEYIMGSETQAFGDLGPLLGAAIRRRLDDLGVPIVPSVARIRATAIGAAQYTLQVSGTTIYITDAGLLPLHNLQVVAPHLPEGDLTAAEVADATRAALRRGDVADEDRPVALAIRWDREPAYRNLRALADGVVDALGHRTDRGVPIVLAFDGDVGGMIGNVLATEAAPGVNVVSVDELRLSDFDYIDIGAELKHVQAVPVIIKSLVFRPPHPHAHDHMHDHDAHGHNDPHDHDHVHGNGHDHEHGPATHTHDHATPGR
jgi:ethanolamine utilization protein EutA